MRPLWSLITDCTIARPRPVLGHYYSLMRENKEEARMAETILSDDLRQRVEDFAREQNREPAEVLEEAVRRYAGAYRLERFAEKAGTHARALGIKEEDVPRLVDEVRRENEARGR